jgi:polar amino acid transport system substrate-binding protein
MKQLVQNYRTGELSLDEVPEPTLRPGGVLVRTAFSLISAGTEKSIVETAKSSLVGKARNRPDLVRQVYDTFKREGFRATYEKVTARLNQVKGLGYSSAGSVIAVGRNAQDFRVGDRVACAGGGYASHAEVNFIPRNLCARVPEEVSLETACYSTVAAIALQGVRQAEPRLGETVAVIGLGLVGQLTVQLLKSGGCQVLGMDIDPSACELAKLSGADRAEIDKSSAKAACDELSHGRGADCIIITAATKSSEPVGLAAELARDRARIVVVGLVGMDVPRHSFYEKELELRLSRSYGPGRYDSSYEEDGVDYPVGYVRWTERRNMEAFLQLAREGKVNTGMLTTHRFAVDDATRAYDLILNRRERYCGVVIEYPGAKSHQPRVAFRPAIRVGADQTGVSFIGAGNFARGVLLPILKRSPRVKLMGVSAASGISAKNTASQFGFDYSSAGHEEILDDERAEAVFIATRHDLHAPLAAEALRRGKAVFVEKPLAIDRAGLREVATAAITGEGLLMTGFNRRFAPLVVEARQRLSGRRAPMTICYRVNAGQLPAAHWTLDPDEGGGRIVGEVCHFIDLAQYLTGGLPTQVSAAPVTRSVQSGNVDDSVIVTIALSDGSIASVSYAASGDPSIPKERIEIFCGQSYVLIDDFSLGTFVFDRRKEAFGRGHQDKGHEAEIAAFLEAVRTGESPIALESMVATTLATFVAAGEYQTGSRGDIDAGGFLSECTDVR